MELRWSSKRLTRDLVGQVGASNMAGVPRADRLGRAAGGVVDTASVRPAGLFELAMWNGRLQAPREQLDALAARVRSYGWDDRARSMRKRLKWLLTFSAKLECCGPMHTYLDRFEGDEPSRPFVARKGGELGIRHDVNESRKGNAKLILSRLPGLRVLSVDLGHRFAAACAVWQVLTAKQLAHETTGRSLTRGSSDAQSLLLHTRHRDPATGRNRITIYRRIGTDRVTGGRTHPGPWARLERQFLVKLQGEEGPTRKAAPRERTAVSDLERAVGRLRDAGAPLPTDVGGLMAEAVRTSRLALRRHGDAARIAYAFSPDATRQLPGGGSELHSAESRVDAIREALVRWFDLARGDRWHHAWAAEAWVRTLECDLPTLPADLTPGARRRMRGSIEEQLAPLAARLVARGTDDIHRMWEAHWRDLDGEWRPRLRWLRDWILPRGLRADKKEAPDHSAERKNRRRAARWVGGLSLTRISTVRELYQLQKAFAMRPHPGDLRQNVSARGDDRFDKFGSSVLLVMERLRTQRVKQTASRIIEAALGIGRAPVIHGKARQCKRPRIQVDAPCHVIVVENLRSYRPDEMQTRRENRQLLQWAAGKVRDRLTEACRLHGVYLRDVQPNYTSRQCSRSGLPGVRCQDVSVHDFLTKAHWARMTDDAVKRLSEGGSDSLDAMLLDLRVLWMNAPSGSAARQRPLRIPRTGGDLFVASGPQSREGACVQADLNAAANIGLRALLDPDFPGRWWYVPCDSSTGLPTDDRCAGAACFTKGHALLEEGLHERSRGAKGREPSSRGARDVVNAWRDASAQAVTVGEWMGHAQYWAGVRKRVIRHLRLYNGLES
jgi:IS605 OrfB family transposase